MNSKYNPRYVLFAKSYNRTPEQQEQDESKNFMRWIQNAWSKFFDAHPILYRGWSGCYQSEFTTWLTIEVNNNSNWIVEFNKDNP